MKKKKHKSRRYRQYKQAKFKQNLKYCLIIALVCLVLSVGIAIITGKMPDFVERTIDRQMDRVIGGKQKEIERDLRDGADDGEVRDLIKKYEEYIDR